MIRSTAYRTEVSVEANAFSPLNQLDTSLIVQRLSPCPATNTYWLCEKVKSDFKNVT